MAVTRTFRVFVSSTFSDLKAERNAMQTRVFPALRRLCEQHGARFQPIDLRWGVSEEAALDQQAMKICLSEIRRCQAVSPRPNFIILLGNRYGWRPLPAEIPVEEYKRLESILPGAARQLVEYWYPLDVNALPPVRYLKPRTGESVDPAVWGPMEATLHDALETAARAAGFSDSEMIKYQTSATEQEIIHGAIETMDAGEHIFCFSRETAGVPAGAAGRDFLDLAGEALDASAQARLQDLKTRLHSVLGGHYKEYIATWQDGAPSRDHLEAFCQDIYDSLAGVILTELEHPHEAEAPEVHKPRLRAESIHDAEGLAQRQFAEERIRFFVGREDVLGRISAYLGSGERHVLGVVGAGGTGKSALMAKAVEQAQAVHSQTAIVYRFIGATPSSSNGRSLLDGLCREISRHYGADQANLPTDFRDLAPELARRMALATAQNPLILFLDSLDQLAAAHGARSLIWLPAELPAHVAVVVSCRQEEDLAAALRARQAQELPLGGLEPADGQTLLAQWLENDGRTLQDAQRRHVLEKFAASQGNPLYLKLAFEEARLWRSGDGMPPETLQEGVGGIIAGNTLDRLKKEASHGEALVAGALGYLAAARYGLAEDELVDLLSRDVDVYAWFFTKSYHLPSDLLASARRVMAPGQGTVDETAVVAWLNNLRQDAAALQAFLEAVLPAEDGPRLPVVLWSRLSFDLAPYLSERLVDGNALLHFYHRELGDAAHSLFLQEAQAQKVHARLAAYFQSKADPAGDHTWGGMHRHGLAELPYHLIFAGKRQETFTLLTDFRFLEQKAQQVGITRRQGAQEGIDEVHSQGVLDLQQDIESALAVFYGGGGQGGEVAAPLIITARQKQQELSLFCPVCGKTSTIGEKDLGQVIPCPQEGCSARLKLNPFTVKVE